MNRDGLPLWITTNADQHAAILNRVDLGASGIYSEAWLQNLLHCHPAIFPVKQIEPGFGELIPLCLELPLEIASGKYGALDNLFATKEGGLVLVEAKLWRNPEARRSVVAQAMEYAAALFSMSYSALESAVLQARHGESEPAASLFEIVAKKSQGLDEVEFIDAISKNLVSGRAIVAVIGDGIREDIKPLANLLQSHAGHRFTFALVEMAVYETPTPSVRLVVPSVLAQTVLIERGVVRIEINERSDLRVAVESAPSQLSAQRMTIGEDEFYETLETTSPGTSSCLRAFLSKAEAFGVYAERQGGLNLKHVALAGPPLNLAVITKTGIVDTGFATFWGRKEHGGQTYNKTLATLIGGVVAQFNGGADSALRAVDNRMPRLSDLLPRHEQAWLDAMEQYVRDVSAQSAAQLGATANA